MKHVTDKIQAWLGGELTAAEANAFAAHLQVCDDCAAAARQAQDLWELLAAAADPVPATTPSVWEAVRAETLDDGEKFTVTLSAFGSLTALAAGLVLAVILPWGRVFTDGTGGSVLAEVVDPETYWLTDTSWGAEVDGYGMAQVWFSETGTDEGDGS